jgi:hypothetical protein
MPDLSTITNQTIAMQKAQATELAKDATTQGYTTATGLTGFNLEAPSKSLFPVLSPLRNVIPRTKAQNGAKTAQWKAITAINAGNARATTPFGAAGNTISTKEQDFAAPYKIISLGDTVQYDAQIQAQGFQDLRATSGVNTLYALMEQEEVVLMGGQNFTLGTPSAPSLVNATTGGTIGPVNVGVAVAARTMQGYYDGQSGLPSTQATTGVLTGATNQVTATAVYVPGATIYDWYVGTAGGTLYYYGSTTINIMVISNVPVAAATTTGITYGGASLPGYYTNATPPVWTASTTAAIATAAGDNSIDTNAFNGIIASLVGDYVNGQFVQHGTGLNCGSYIASLNGALLTGNNGTINEIDAALMYLWNNARVSPTKILMNATDRVNASNKMIATGGAYLMFQPDNVAQRQGVVGGQVVSQYINKAMNGVAIPIEVHPYLPQGTILGLTESLPYPNNKVSNVLEIETQLEYQQIEYAVNRQSGTTGGPRYDFEVRAQETFKNYFPGSMFMIQNVKNG